MSNGIARALSVFGHPMLTLPLAALTVAMSRGQSSLALWMGLGLALFAAVVMGYSWRQVRRGRWRHVDASGKNERQSLNRFLLIAFGVGAVLAAWRSDTPELVLGLALSAAMIAIAMVSARWCKLSLHVAFVVLASMLLGYVSWWAAVAGLFFAIAVAWSRLHLQRHVPRDLIAGAATGALAGFFFLVLAKGAP